MAAYEYRVIPAPAKGVKVKGVKTPEGRFAHALQELMNKMGAEGWEYQRADTLPSTERAGLTGTTTHWRHVLIFRRALPDPGEVSETKAQIARGLIIAPPREPANAPGPHLLTAGSAGPRTPAVTHEARGEGGAEDAEATPRLDSSVEPPKNTGKSDV